MEDDERRAVARREGGDRLEDTVFSSGGLRGVAREEVVARLLGGELADGGEDTEGVACQHDDVRRLAVCKHRGSAHWQCTRWGTRQRVFSVMLTSS